MVRVAKQTCAVCPAGVDIGLWTGTVLDGTVSLTTPVPRDGIGANGATPSGGLDLVD
jgi:hypothetical protein